MSPYVGQTLFSAATIQSSQIKYCLIAPCVNAHAFPHAGITLTEDFPWCKGMYTANSVFVVPTQAYAKNFFQQKKQIASVLFSLFFGGMEMFHASVCVHFPLVSVWSCRLELEVCWGKWGVLWGKWSHTLAWCPLGLGHWHTANPGGQALPPGSGLFTCRGRN